MLLDQYDYSKVDSKAKVWKEAKSIVYQINDKTLQRAYLDEVDKLINLMTILMARPILRKKLFDHQLD